MKTKVSIENAKDYKLTKQLFDAAYAREVMSACKGNVTEAARFAGKERKDFYDLLKRAEVSPQEFRE